jgi:hypothetical protein
MQYSSNLFHGDINSETSFIVMKQWKITLRAYKLSYARYFGMEFALIITAGQVTEYIS